MNYFLIDDVARTLAKPMPRRKALWRIGGLLAAAFLANTTLSAAIACGSGGCTADNQCTGNDKCVAPCTGGSGFRCCPKNTDCSCGQGQCCSADKAGQNPCCN